MTKYFTWSPTGQLLSLTISGTTYYAVHNGHGDIVQLTDGTGKVVVTYTYDAWGNITNTWSDPSVANCSTVANSNPYRYADYRYDNDTGLYYLIGRYYDPSMGRFISSDPTSLVPSYTYAGNNPLSYVDPNGYRMEEDDTGVKADSSSYTGDDNTCDYDGEVDDYSSWDDSYNAPLAVGAVAVVEESAAAVVVAEVGAAALAPAVVVVTGIGLAAYGAYSLYQFAKNTSGLPSQGEVSEMDDAPPVASEKQGKHVPGHPNYIPGRSSWPEGETGVKETQEAWKHGKELKRSKEGVVKEWNRGPGLPKIRVHGDKQGRIHGYPTP